MKPFVTVIEDLKVRMSFQVSISSQQMAMKHHSDLWAAHCWDACSWGQKACPDCKEACGSWHKSELLLPDLWNLSLSSQNSAFFFCQKIYCAMLLPAKAEVTVNTEPPASEKRFLCIRQREYINKA